MVHAQGRYGENCYIPLSVGVLWAYARTFKDITDAYEMVDFLYLKESIEVAVARLENPQLLALAHYLWNAEWNKAFAQAVKAKFPSCVIIVGGVQVPDESPRILEEQPYFDFGVYGEGEGAFADFLREHAGDQHYWDVGSLIWKNDGEICVNPRHAFTDLAELRSPYLDGVFDELWSREPRWQVLQESNRGCGVGCHFCAWGQAAQNKLRLLPIERVNAESEWFGQHKVIYVDQADANFAVVKRDIDITKHLVAVKEKYGYPHTFRTSFAKNSNDTVWEIANILHDAKMLKSVTLAMQSMDDGVLVAIHRKNIKYNKFGELIKRYESAGIPTYTELIIGLPEETLDTFLNGIDSNLEAGQHSGLFCYLNLCLENTEQRKPEYMKMYGLRALPMKAMLSHGTPDNTVPREMQDIIVETAAMSHEDWKRAWLYSKVIEVFHAQGLLQNVAIACHARGLKYRDFYTQLIDWMRANPDTVAGRQLAALEKLLDGVLAGGLWDCMDVRFGEISWPPEEFAFARICLELDTFYDEVEMFLTTLPLDIETIVKQREVISEPWDDTVAWAQEVIWYQRKGNAAKLRQARTGGE